MDDRIDAAEHYGSGAVVDDCQYFHSGVGVVGLHQTVEYSDNYVINS